MTTDIVDRLRAALRTEINDHPGSEPDTPAKHRFVERLYAMIEGIDEIERLRTRLEIDPGQQYDGIATRDATIKLLEVEIETLRASLAAYRRRLPAFVPPEAEISVVEWPKL